MKKYWIPLFLFFCISQNVFSQDKHFSQFYASPLSLNPALTGSFNGTYRASAIYRDQWRGVFDAPIVTYAAAVDVKFDVELDSRFKDYIAVGLQFFSDRVDVIDFTTNQMALSAAFHKGLDFESRQYLSVGIQGALAQRNINYESITFQDQFNDLDDFDRPSLENLPANNFSFSDFSAGINYTFTPKKRTSFFAGVALHHILRPQVSFYYDKDDEIKLGDSRLYQKYSAQLSASLPLSDEISIIPRVLYSLQGPHNRINAGTNFRIQLNNYNSNALQIGGWVRPVKDEDESFNLDALVLMAGIELNAVLIGLSYDTNLSDLSNLSQSRGAFEFSITYLGSYENDESILCPSF